MGKNKNPTIPNQGKYNGQKIARPGQAQQALPESNSLLDVMEENQEYASLLRYRFKEITVEEIRRAIHGISDITGRYTICYIANMINPKISENISINTTDDLPFTEMVNSIPPEIHDIDVIIATPGGSGEQVQRFVDKLRPRFNTVNFIIPDAAMSSGTIWAMSGNDIFMTANSYIGPIDPQVQNRDGKLVPAQSILTAIEDIRERGDLALSQGKQPNWVDLQILYRIDPKEIGRAKMGSGYSIELVKTYLTNYKFASWLTHSNGTPVTQAEKEQRALEIANNLCDSKLWKSHSRGITREVAWGVCKIKIIHSDSIVNFDRAIRRFWAVIYWFFEHSPMYKIFISNHYVLIRQDIKLLPKT